MTDKDGPSTKRAIEFILISLAVIIAGFLLFKRFLFLPKVLIVGLIILTASLLGKVKPLIKDWFVFIAFIYLFDSLRGSIYILTCKLHLPVYTFYVLDIEKALFGAVPSVTLQNLLLHPDPLGNFTWLEKTLTVFYGSHFIAFLLVGFLIWLSKAKGFRLFKSSFYLLISLGILGYAFIPTVPPWMASSQFGLIPILTRFNAILFNFAIPDLSNGFDTNPIAAMPSLHAAFPILCSLLLWRFFRWKALPFHVYTLIVLFTIVYTGDHYFIDILAGLILSIVCFLLALKLQKKIPVDPEKGLLSEEGNPFRGIVLKKRLLMGLGVLLIGVIIGSINKTQFVLHANSFNLYVPRYVDFFKDPNRYRDSYLVQYYFGNYYAARKEFRTALGYFERSLELARNTTEKSQARMNLGICRHALSLSD